MEIVAPKAAAVCQPASDIHASCVDIGVVGTILIGFSHIFFHTECTILCMIKIFRGEGVVDGEGGSSEGCLKWGGGGGGSSRDLSKNILKQGVDKGKSCS